MINTGKLASTSSSLIKKIKEQESDISSSKITGDKSNAIANKLLHDFPEIKAQDQSFKSRLININNELTNYENDLSKTQLIEEKMKTLENQMRKKDFDKIKDTLENSIYENEKIFKGFIPSSYNQENINSVFSNLRKYIQEKNVELDNKFKEIEVKSQNIVSLYSYPMNINDSSIKNLNLEKIVDSTNLNHKRVIDLIS